MLRCASRNQNLSVFYLLYKPNIVRDHPSLGDIIYLGKADWGQCGNRGRTVICWRSCNTAKYPLSQVAAMALILFWSACEFAYKMYSSSYAQRGRCYLSMVSVSEHTSEGLDPQHIEKSRGALLFCLLPPSIFLHHCIMPSTRKYFQPFIYIGLPNQAIIIIKTNTLV